MSTQSGEARQEATAFEEPQTPDPTPAKVRRRARSVPIAFPEVQPGTPEGDSPSPSREAVEHATEAITRLRALFAVPARSSLLHSQPSSLAQTRARHKEAAQHWEAVLARWPRHLWGWGHLALKALLHLIEWVTESPARFIVAAAFLAACWLWL